MISFQGMPEEEDLRNSAAGSFRGVVATRFGRDADVEAVLKERDRNATTNPKDRA